MVVGQNVQVHPEKWRIAPHVVDLETSVIREILKISSQPGVISFAGGLPAPELFPLDEMMKSMEEAFKNHGSAAVQYSLSSGITPLRELIAKRETEKGMPSEMSNILIVSGSQQGIELIGRAFIDPGDYILVENPTYLGALQAFNYYQARYATVDMDDDGMVVDQVEDQIKKYNPKFIYTVSNFHNPTGITMTEERRHALIEIASEYNIPIVDDNPYGDIRFMGEEVPSLKALGGDAVIAANTFSKILAPGIRIGWLNGPIGIMGQFEKVKQTTDLHTNALVQCMVYEYVKAGKLEPHIERIKADYRKKLELMLKAIKDEFPPEIKVAKVEGGLFLWCELPKNISAKDLFRHKYRSLPK